MKIIECIQKQTTFARLKLMALPRWACTFFLACYVSSRQRSFTLLLAMALFLLSLIASLCLHPYKIWEWRVEWRRGWIILTTISPAKPLIHPSLDPCVGCSLPACGIRSARITVYFILFIFHTIFDIVQLLVLAFFALSGFHFLLLALNAKAR